MHQTDYPQNSQTKNDRNMALTHFMLHHMVIIKNKTYIEDLAHVRFSKLLKQCELFSPKWAHYEPKCLQKVIY